MCADGDEAGADAVAKAAHPAKRARTKYSLKKKDPLTVRTLADACFAAVCPTTVHVTEVPSMGIDRVCGSAIKCGVWLIPLRCGFPMLPV